MGRILLWRPWGEAGDGDKAPTGQPAPHGPFNVPLLLSPGGGEGGTAWGGRQPPEAARWRGSRSVRAAGARALGFFSPSSCLLIIDPAALAEAVWGNFPVPSLLGTATPPSAPQLFRGGLRVTPWAAHLFLFFWGGKNEESAAFGGWEDS